MLTSHTTCNRTVNFTCQPILTSNSLKLQNLLDIFFNFIFTIFNIGEMFSFGFILHHCFRGISEHIRHLQINGFLSGSGIFKHETMISRGLPDHVHRSPFPISHTLQGLHVLCFHYEAHPFLGFISHDLFVGKCRITDRQFLQVNQSTCFLHQLGQAVQMSSCPVVVNRNNRVYIALGHRPDGVTYPSLHFRIGTLHRIQLNSVGIYSRIHGRNGTTTHSDAIIITP